MAEIGPGPHRSGDIADKLGVPVSVVHPLLKDRPKKQVVCKLCGEDARYIKSELCYKHYMRGYYERTKNTR